MKNAYVEELAMRIKEADTWDLDDCKALCEAAGLGDEWEESDGETFERVVERAADILGVEIL